MYMARTMKSRAPCLSLNPAQGEASTVLCCTLSRWLPAARRRAAQTRALPAPTNCLVCVAAAGYLLPQTAADSLRPKHRPGSTGDRPTLSIATALSRPRPLPAPPACPRESRPGSPGESRAAPRDGAFGRMPNEWRTARMSGWPGRMRRAAAQRRREAPGQRTLRGSRRRRSGGTAQASSPLRLERAAGLAGPDEQPLRLDRLGPCRTGPVRSGPGQAGPGDFRVPRDHVPPRGLETPRAPGAPFSKTGRRRRTGLLRL